MSQATTERQQCNVLRIRHALRNHRCLIHREGAWSEVGPLAYHINKRLMAGGSQLANNIKLARVRIR